MACGALAIVGGALIVAWATTMEIHRCPDGWSNRGAVRWSLVLATLFVDAPALGCAAWSARQREGSVPLRRTAVVIGIIAPLATIVLAFAAMPAATSTCLD